MRQRFGWMLGLCLVAGVAFAGQEAMRGPGQRPELQLALQQRYPLTIIGEGVFGLRGRPDSIRQAGAVVLVQRSGLHGSVERVGGAVLNVGLDPQPSATGRQDTAIPAGERFYVHTIYVGTDVITFGLMSVQLLPAANGNHRLWSSVNFFFPAAVLHRGDHATVIARLEEWLVPESLRPVAVRPAESPAVAAPAPAPAASPGATLQLVAGMPQAEAIAVLGSPLRTVEFGTRSWLYYPGLALTFVAGKLAEVDRLAGPPATVAVNSEPAGAEVWLDGRLVSETPATLEIPAGWHRLQVRKAGYADWMREVEILSGSRLTFSAALARK
jgi:hypothetical protein